MALPEYARLNKTNDPKSKESKTKPEVEDRLYTVPTRLLEHLFDQVQSDDQEFTSDSDVN